MQRSSLATVALLLMLMMTVVPSSYTPSAFAATATICATQSVPTGWVIIRRYASASCPSGISIPPNNTYVIESHYNKVIGSTMEMCHNQSIPAGWVQVSSYRDTFTCPTTQTDQGPTRYQIQKNNYGQPVIDDKGVVNANNYLWYDLRRGPNTAVSIFGGNFTASGNTVYLVQGSSTYTFGAGSTYWYEDFDQINFQIPGYVNTGSASVYVRNSLGYYSPAQSITINP